MPCPIIKRIALESIADDEGRDYLPSMVLDKPCETFRSLVELVEEEKLEAEEEDIFISDICPICCSICSILPPVARRSSAAMLMMLRWCLAVIDTNRDVK